MVKSTVRVRILAGKRDLPSKNREEEEEEEEEEGLGIERRVSE